MICFRCKLPKPDDKQTWCQSCKREYHLLYNRRPEIKQKRWKYRHTLKGIEKRRKRDEINRENRHKELNRYRAYDAVKYAVKIGKLPKIKNLKCVHCQNQAYEYHHLYGYEIENRLNVIPCCHYCHRQADSLLRKSVSTKSNPV